MQSSDTIVVSKAMVITIFLLDNSHIIFPAFIFVWYHTKGRQNLSTLSDSQWLFSPQIGSVSRPGKRRKLDKNMIFIQSIVNSYRCTKQKLTNFREKGRAVNSITQDCYNRPHHVTQATQVWLLLGHITHVQSQVLFRSSPADSPTIFFCRDLEI